jgi:hypothetical protein
MTGSFVDDYGTTYSYEDIRKIMTEPYTMQLVGKDAQVVHDAVNIGIDSHLEACYIPERGDRYEFKDTMVGDKILVQKLDCIVSFSSLPVLLRRLFETGDEQACDLGRIIIETLKDEEP